MQTSTLLSSATLASDYQARRRQLASQLPAGTQVLIASGSPLARNYPANPYDFRASSHFLYYLGWNEPHCAALLQDGQCTLFHDPRSLEDAVWEGPGAKAEDLEGRYGFDTLSKFTGMAVPSGVLVVEPGAAALAGRPFEPDGRDRAAVEAVIAQRLHNDEAACRQLRDAADLTVRAHQAGARALATAANELDVLAAMMAVVIAGGGTTSFHPIVSVRGETLHNHSCGNPLSPGQLLLVDFGAENREGWAGDITRTHPVGGSLNARQADFYKVVLEANQRCIEACRPGAEFRRLHDLASLVLTRGLVDMGILKGDPETLVERGAHTLFFPHGLGHLLGLDVHDMEELGDRVGYAAGRQRSQQFGTSYLRLDRVLTEGMAVTIEPGLYWIPDLLDNPQHTDPYKDCLDFKVIEGYRGLGGVRIEDDVLITGSGAEVLTSALAK